MAERQSYRIVDRGSIPRPRSKSWTKREESKLRRLYPASKWAHLQRGFGRSRHAIKSRAGLLGLRRANCHKHFSESEVALIRELYPRSMETQDIARQIGRPVHAICRKANKLGLRKDPDVKAELLKQCGHKAAVHPLSIAARIQKGNVPANKGKKMPPGWGPGRMKETQFKKGERLGAANHNWKPVGTIQMNADGYLVMKVKDEPQSVAGVGANSTNWMFVHKMVWEKANGPIPPGHRIWWKDGDHNNCALENLELLSDKAHMARTTVHNLPPKLKRVVILRGAIKRRITIHEKRRANAGSEHSGRAARRAV